MTDQELTAAVCSLEALYGQWREPGSREKIARLDSQIAAELDRREIYEWLVPERRVRACVHRCDDGPSSELRVFLKPHYEARRPQ